MLNRKERNELDALSKEVFGSSSRWQKLVLKGHPEIITEEKVETVPPEKEGEQPTEKKINVPVKTTFAKSGEGSNQYTTKHYSVESIKTLMLEQKAQMDQIRATIQKHQEEAKAAKEAELKAQRIHETMAGSAKV